jgi:hypothetical protein
LDDFAKFAEVDAVGVITVGHESSQWKVKGGENEAQRSMRGAGVKRKNK